MRWLHATPSSATGRPRWATVYKRSLKLIPVRSSPLAVAVSSSDPRAGPSRCVGIQPKCAATSSADAEQLLTVD